jgi:hypothetical protein
LAGDFNRFINTGLITDESAEYDYALEALNRDLQGFKIGLIE